jgi:hypothetical protein
VLREDADAANFFIIVILSKKDAVMDKAPKQPMTHAGTHTKKKSSITIQVMTNDTLLHSGKRHLVETRSGPKAAVYWQLLTSFNSGRHGGPGVLV